MDKKLLYLQSVNHDVLTVYIAKGSSVQKTLNLLKREEPIVQNIKSRITRQAIEVAFQKIKSFLANPPPSENGYIIVASATDFAWTTEFLIEKDFYRCGNEFHAAPLEEILLLKLYPIGIITLDTKEATLGHIGSTIQILKYMTSGIPGKSHKGGSSQRRYERERDMAVAAFFKRVGDAAKLFVENYPIEELLISGCGHTKDDFLKAKYLDYRLKEKITEVIDTQYTGEHGIRETLHKALPLLQKNCLSKEIFEVQKFQEILGKEIRRVAYGEEDVKQNLQRIIKLIVLEDFVPSWLKDYSGEIFVLHCRGEHWEIISNLGKIVGIKG